MAKVAGREDRQRDERRMLLVQSKNVRGQRQFRHIELLKTELAEKAAAVIRLVVEQKAGSGANPRLLYSMVEEVQLDSLRPHPAILQRFDAIIVPTGD